mgnify:CR=1 FL=1
MDVREIDRVMEGYLQNREMAGGALLVRKDDEIVYDGKWGFADLAARTPVTDDTIFRIASMTKIVTAVGILKLSENGVLSLDDPLSKYLPEFSESVLPEYRFCFLSSWPSCRPHPAVSRKRGSGDPEW